MDKETTIVHLRTKIAAITPTAWNYDFDPDEIFKINPYNIVGELITIPVLVNRLGNLVAELNTYIKRQKAELKIAEADVARIFRKDQNAAGMKKPTVQEMDDHLTLDLVLKDKRFKLINLEGDLQKLESMHDSAQKKSFNIGILGRHLVPAEFETELIEGSINGVMIKLRDKRIQ